MRPRAKPTQAKIDAKPSRSSKASKKQGTRIRDLEKRLAEAVKREAEALDQQTATSAILRVISASPTDAQPVFDAIVRSAVRLCDARFANVFRLEGEVVHLVAHHNLPLKALDQFRRTFPQPLSHGGTITAQAMLRRAVIHIHDIELLSDVPVAVRELSSSAGYRSALAVPILRKGSALGAIGVGRSDGTGAPRPFSDTEIDLLTSFADQASIAIENVRLFTELDARNRDLTEALEQQTATAEVLKVISRSTFDLQPVLDALIENAARLCASRRGVIMRRDGASYHGAAFYNVSAELIDFIRRHPIQPGRHSITARVALERRTIHVVDLQDDAEYRYALRDADPIGTELGVPMFRGDDIVGVIILHKLKVQPFTEKQIELVETFADQAVIAIENVRLFTELQTSNRDLTTALDTQTATSDILRVISRSQTDVQPVFDAILQSAVRLLGGYSGTVTRVVGDQIEIAALTSTDATGDAAQRERYPQALRSGGSHATAIRNRTPFNIADTQTDPGLPEPVRAFARVRGYRGLVVVPLLRQDEVLGAISVTRREAGGFTDDEITLLQTFADQAVIAIENARLLSELQERNEALTQAHAQVSEALEQQTATSEVLKVMSRSAFDLQPVLDSLIESAVRLCGADRGFIHRRDGEFYPVAASYGHSPDWIEVVKRNPIRQDRSSATGRAGLARRTIHIHDILAEPEYRWADDQRGQEQMHRTILAVPMLREGVVTGVITIRRTHVQPFTDKQIELVETFADQAVIAVENVRLFTELQASNRELTTALDTQTATSDILRVISRSQTDVQPVFDAIVDSAVRLLRGDVSSLSRIEGDQIALAAMTSTNDPGDASQRARFPMSIHSEEDHAQAVRNRAPLNSTDAHSDPRLPETQHASARLRGYRSLVVVPLVRRDEAVGALGVARREPGGFTDDEIALLQTFADQAVIAIENARLLSELQEKNVALTQAHAQVTESLEQQTATSEILRVIAASPSDIQPVFDAIAAHAARLCDAVNGLVIRFDGQLLHLAAQHNVDPERLAAVRQAYPRPPSRGALSGRAILTRAVVHVPDVSKDPEYTLPAATTIGYRSVLAVPMMHEGVARGTILVARDVVAPFSETHIALIQTFAAQAVIAIENVRLFTELKDKNGALAEALEQQTATSELLKVIGRSTFDLQPVFETLAENAIRLCEAERALIFRFDGQVMRVVATHNVFPELRAFIEQNPITPGRGSGIGRAALERRTIHIHDIRTDPEYTYAGQQIAPYRTVLVVPMLRAGELLGIIAIHRHEVRPFMHSQITLMETFADQAAIAIENTQLFKELEARTAQLSRSVQELQALGEVSQALSSTLDLETVLSTIVARANQLAGTDGGSVYEYDEPSEAFHLRATDNLDEEVVVLARHTPVPRSEGVLGRMAVTREPVQIPDIGEESAYHSPLRDVLLRTGTRALLAIPLLREDHLIGGLTVNKKTPGEFSPQVIDLLRTFASQSALAIQNARLFREIEDKSRQLEVASQHKSEFLANMSHELRTPLNAIIGFSEVLGERMFGELNDKQEEYLKDIYTSGQHLLSLINDILDLSKIEAGRMELELTDFNLPATLDNALTLVRERAGRRGIALGLTVDERLEQIHADERKVRQVVLNLLSNAIKFTPEGGRIEVRAVPVEENVEVSVSDTGVGIAPEDQEAIFEEFRQVGTAAKKVEGTGLGLALSRKFVELHGGRIWVESRVGVGSTFTFTIPIRTGA